MSSLNLINGSLVMTAPYDRAFVDEFKAKIPYTARRWDPASKKWLVDPSQGDEVARLLYVFFGETVTVPTATVAATPTIRLTQMLYLGRCKDRGNGQTTASGFADGSWSLSFPETLLRTFFCDEATAPASETEPEKPKSLYAILGIPAFSEADAIKPAYRRMARVWHPDVCKEPDAKERLQAINHAYSVLKDGQTKRKYDVGLTLEMRASQQVEPMARYSVFVRPQEYRAPLMCGLVLVQGTERLGVLHVDTILKWDDITDADGRTMVSSWPIGAKNFEVKWVDA